VERVRCRGKRVASLLALENTTQQNTLRENGEKMAEGMGVLRRAKSVKPILCESECHKRQGKDARDYIGGGSQKEGGEAV